MAQRIWCPGCGCDVAHLLRKVQPPKAPVKPTIDPRPEAVRWLREVVAAMDAHAAKKSDVLMSVPDIYRLWSRDLLGEVEKFVASTPSPQEPR